MSTEQTTRRRPKVSVFDTVAEDAHLAERFRQPDPPVPAEPAKAEPATKPRDPQATFYFEEGQLQHLDRLCAEYFSRTGLRINRNDVVRHYVADLTIDKLLRENIIPKAAGPRERGSRKR